MKNTIKTTLTMALTSLFLFTGCTNSTPEANRPSEAASISISASPSASPSVSSTVDTREAITKLSTAQTPLGEIIVDENGMTVYVFTKDQKDSGKSECSGECIKNWPPVIAEETPDAEGDVNASIGTIDLENGTKQVTVNGMPIYYWANDTEKGDVNGQGINQSWYVISPDGTMNTEAVATQNVTGTAASTSTSSPRPTESMSPMPTMGSNGG